MILVIDLCWKKDSLSHTEFVVPIVNLCRQHASVVVRHFTQVAPEDLEMADRIVMCGTALQDNSFAEPENLSRFEWLKSTSRPVLGICAGMQVLGALFGVPRVVSKEIGMKRLTVLKPNPLFSGHTLDAYCLHSFSLLPVMRDFDALARSEQCVQAIAHKTKPLYGVLFHPEVRNENVVKNFLTS